MYKLKTHLVGQIQSGKWEQHNCKYGSVLTSQFCQVEKKLSRYRFLANRAETYLLDHLATACGMLIAGVLRMAWRLDVHGRVVRMWGVL